MDTVKEEPWALDKIIEAAEMVMRLDQLQNTVPACPDGEEPAERILSSFIVLKALQKKIEDRLEAFKPYLHEAAENLGKDTEKGGQLWEIGGNSLLREKRVDTEPDNDLLRALLKERGIEVTDCFDTKQELILNQSKLQLKIDLGKVAAEDVEKLKKVGWALKPSAGPKLKKTLESIFKKAKPKKAERERK